MVCDVVGPVCESTDFLGKERELCLATGDLLAVRGAFRFRRDVDYCSGAFLLFASEKFRELGGFDEAYAPAYYEESDFCLRLYRDAELWERLSRTAAEAVARDCSAERFRQTLREVVGIDPDPG